MMKRVLFFVIAISVLLAGCNASEKAPENTPAPAEATATPETEAPAEDVSVTPSVSQTYIDILKSGTYYMKATVSGENGKGEFFLSVHPDSIGMKTVAEDASYSVVIKDGITSMIDHQSKMVITSASKVASSASKMVGDTIPVEGLVFVQSASGVFEGKTLPFDEYKSASGDTVRFYINGTSLAGIETLQGDISILYKVSELSKENKPEMHIVPSEYALIDMAALGG